MENRVAHPYLGKSGYAFIGYAHRNEEEVMDILEEMTLNGFFVWYDKGITPGLEYDKILAKRIKGCELFIGFISRSFFASEYCKDEILYARDCNKTILLVYLEKAELPEELALRLSRIQAIYKYEYDKKHDFFKVMYRANKIELCRGEEKNEKLEDNVAYSGYGDYIYPDGTKYEGEWKDGRFDGHGKMFWSDGRIYDGEWKAGKYDGCGRMTWPDRRVYEGEWKNGYRTGYGKMSWPGKKNYDGEWKNGKINGGGKMTWADGRVYRGEWKKGKRNGTGQLTWPSGSKYEGNWKDGNRTGYGKMYFPDGRIYEGEWKDGKLHGNGKEMVADYISEGPFVEGKKHGWFLEYSVANEEKKQIVEYVNGDRR